MRLDLSVVDVEIRAPLRPSGSTPAPRPLLLVRLRHGDGSTGHGEAAPLEAYDGISIERTLQALSAYEPILSRAEDRSHADVLRYCTAADPLPQALAAVDLALWDMAGQRDGQPVSSLLGASDPLPVEVNATIGAVDPAAAAQEAQLALAAGFKTVKVKVGTPDDRQRLAAIRDATGPELRIRVDANGAWTQLDAPERIRALSRFEVELFEEPVHGQDAVAAVAGLVPESALAVDESAGAALADSDERCCDAVCLKIASGGGISGVIAQARRARELGYRVYLASTLDGPLGIAAALHTAAIIEPDLPCGLTTLDRFAAGVPASLAATGGSMGVPAGAGLSDGLIAWYDAQ